MAKIFIIQEGTPYFTAAAMQVPKLKSLIDKFPDDYDKYAAYLYHMTSPTSTYFDYGPEKEEKILDDFAPELKGKKLHKLIPECMAELHSFKAAEMRLLESTLIACDKIGQYLESVDFSEADEHGRLIHSPTQVMNSLGRIGTLVEGLAKVREQVKKGLQSQEEYYGDRELNMFDQVKETNE